MKPGFAGALPVRLLLILFLLFAYTIISHAETKPCVTKQGCPEGIKPPGCCQPPPCEFYEQLKSKRAMQRLYANKRARKLMLKKYGDTKEGADQFYQFVLKKVDKMNHTSRCKKKSVDFPPDFETKNSDCRIYAKLGKDEKGNDKDEMMSKENAHSRFGTCSEFIDAIYNHEDFHKDVCFHTNSTERLNQPLMSFVTEEVGGYQKEIDSLKADLQSFWGACSATVDSASARKIAQAGISTLKKKSKKNEKQAKIGG